MPRLFVSHRQQPVSNSPPIIAAPSPSPPPVAMPIIPPAVVPVPRPIQGLPTNAINDEGLPLVLVPPVPKTLAKLMDSHDMDNPYLVASFNVLIENVRLIPSPDVSYERPFLRSG